MLGVRLFVRVFVTNQLINQASNAVTYTLISEIRGSNTRIIKNIEKKIKENVYFEEFD